MIHTMEVTRGDLILKLVTRDGVTRLKILVAAEWHDKDLAREAGESIAACTNEPHRIHIEDPREGYRIEISMERTWPDEEAALFSARLIANRLTRYGWTRLEDLEQEGFLDRDASFHPLFRYGEEQHCPEPLLMR